MPISNLPGYPPAYLNDRDIIHAAREYAATRGFYGAKGGWIYDKHQRPYVQGWFLFWTYHKGSIFDMLTRHCTAFSSFRDLLEAESHYRPTLRPTTWRERMLADAYDIEMHKRHDARRAYRGREERHDSATTRHDH